MALSLLASAWVVGILGGLHCLAMCGGFAAAAFARDAASRRPAAPLLPAAVLASRQGTYHAGRLASYALLGAAFGGAGAALLGAGALLPLQRALYLFANVFLLLLGLRLAFGRARTPWLQRAAAGAFSRILPAAKPLLARRDAAGRIALGLVWGLAPCGLVYSVLPLAAFAGGAWQGALTMAAFGVGTVPHFLIAGALLGRLRLAGPALRLAGAALLAGFAVAGIYRLLASPEALPHGGFCLTL